MRVWAISVKEFLHIRRDIRILYFSIIWPVLLLVLFGYTVSYDLKNIRLTVVDLDGQAQSREFYNCLQNTKIFNLNRQHNSSWNGSLSPLDKGQIRGLLVIPPDFTRRLNRFEPISFQVILDGSDNNTARIMMGHLSAMAQEFSRRRLYELIGLHGYRAADLQLPVDYRVRFLYNPALRSQNFIIPGLIAVIMMIIGTLLTAMTISVEWDRGTMEQLMYTPVKPIEFIIGKLMPYFLISLVQMTTVLITGSLLFHVPFRGSLLLFYLAAALFLLGALGTGLLVSLISRNQQVAAMVSFLTSFLPAFMLSGFLFPIASMPAILRSLSLLVPARYFLNITRGLLLKAAGLETLGWDFIIMALYAVVFVFVSVSRFKKRLA